MSNCITITSLFKTSVGSINGGDSEGNIMTVKKVTLSTGEQLPYISGQSIRRMMRDRMAEAGENLSPLNLTEENAAARPEKAPNITAGSPDVYIDDDVFGFMQAVSGSTRRRTAPVRVSAAVGLFAYTGDRDYGTKTKGYEEKDSGQHLTGNIFETEMYSNTFRNTVLIELDRLGNFQEFETVAKSKSEISKEEKSRRLGIVLDSYLNLWGGGKQSRFLTDVGPKVVFYTRQKAKNPIFLESVLVDEEDNLIIEPIIETLREFKNHIDIALIGIRSGFLSEESVDSLKSRVAQLNEQGIPVEVGSLADMKERISADVKKVYGGQS